MGVMIDGAYQVNEPASDSDESGRYRRAAAKIRDWITPDGPFTPEAGRYHLYVAWNCPWAHRALLTRAILGLEDLLPVSYARPRRTDQGWVYDAGGEYADPELGVSAIHEVYARQRPGYTGRCTMPVLWDKTTEQIVSNESADIIRMFRHFGRGPELTPDAMLDEIDAWNARLYDGLNNGVYKAGFARTQEAYDEAVRDVFGVLDAVEERLSDGRRWFHGEHVTETDIRLFPTLARFDVAYHYAFKCNIRRVMDYPNLWSYARRFHALPGVADTVRFWVYKQGYHSPSELRNPLGIVPAGPDIDWSL